MLWLLVAPCLHPQFVPGKECSVVLSKRSLTTTVFVSQLGSAMLALAPSRCFPMVVLWVLTSGAAQTGSSFTVRPGGVLMIPNRRSPLVKWRFPCWRGRFDWCPSSFPNHSHVGSHVGSYVGSHIRIRSGDCTPPLFNEDTLAAEKDSFGAMFNVVFSRADSFAMALPSSPIIPMLEFASGAVLGVASEAVTVSLVECWVP